MHCLNSFINIILCTIPILLNSRFFVDANDFMGANSYFLYAVNETDRDAVLTAMANANMKVLRVFITEVLEGAKGSSASNVPDLETAAVGQYDDNILDLIDDLAYAAKQKDIKLIIAMHDRYALGCDTTDAYVEKYQLPVSSDSCDKDIPNSEAFYLNAVGDYEARVKHILNYWSNNFNEYWYELSDAIFAFDIENEAMGHMDIVAPSWWCNIAQMMRGIMGTSGIQISTGGGTTIALSIQSQFFTCADLQIISLHDYYLDTNYLGTNIDTAKQDVINAGLNQRLLFEEFGALGSNKQSSISSASQVILGTGVPFMYWEVTIPGAGANNYEIWTNEPSWATVVSAAESALSEPGEYGWPEIV